MRGSVLAALVTSATCLGGSRGAPAPAPVPPASVALAPDTATYRVTDRRRVEHAIANGPSLTNAMTLTAFLRARIEPGNDGYTARIVLDSADVVGAGLSADAAAAAAGAELTTAIGRSGGDAAATGAPGNEVLSRVARAVQDLWPRLPPGGTGPGRRWIDTTEHVSRTGGVTLTIVTINERTAGDWLTRAGAPVLPIATAATFSLSGSGLQSGREVAIEGVGRRHARQYLDTAGRYLGGAGADTAEIEIRLLSTGAVVPVREWGADTVEVRR